MHLQQHVIDSHTPPTQQTSINTGQTTGHGENITTSYQFPPFLRCSALDERKTSMSLTTTSFHSILIGIPQLEVEGLIPHKPNILPDHAHPFLNDAYRPTIITWPKGTKWNGHNTSASALEQA